MTAVGIVGLGRIGGGVASALGRAGHELIGYDPLSHVVDDLAPIVSPAHSPADVAAAADVVLVAVMDDGQVRAILSGPGGILSARSLPRAVVILSTVTLDTVRWAAAACGERRVAAFDCGVSGGTQALEHAQIAAMVGGPAESLELVLPVLRGFADPVVYVGPSGTGMSAKLARNLIIYSEWVVAWEATRLALAAGIELEAFLTIVRGSERWSRDHLHLVDQRIGLATADGAPPPSARATAGYAAKDLRAALDLGAELGVDLPASELALQMFPVVAGIDAPAA